MFEGGSGNDEGEEEVRLGDNLEDSWWVWEGGWGGRSYGDISQRWGQEVEEGTPADTEEFRGDRLTKEFQLGGTEEYRFIIHRLLRRVFKSFEGETRFIFDRQKLLKLSKMNKLPFLLFFCTFLTNC